MSITTQTTFDFDNASEPANVDSYAYIKHS